MNDEMASPWTDAERRRPENYWTVGTTAMTQHEAEEAAQLIEGRFPEVHAHAVNPRNSITFHLDRWTAEMIREGLVRLRDAGGEVGNVLEDLDEFLASADPYTDDEEPWPGTP